MELSKKIIQAEIEMLCDADKRNKEGITSRFTLDDALKVLDGAKTATIVFAGSYAVGVEIAFECLRIRGLM
ncbi:MAG: hypothetical protein J6O04_09595 [Selenomonadaceae bacterium]|nr:hypothetical protein [Selenomonadaceae bacterium]